MLPKKVTITLPLPPSVNGLYAGMARRFKSKKYKEWIDEAIEEGEFSAPEMNPDVWLKGVYTFYMPLMCKNGNVKRRDVANYEKATSDFIGDHLIGFDDMMLKTVCLTKVESDRNEVVCVITEIDD